MFAVLGAMHNVSYPSSSSVQSQEVIGELRAIIPREGVVCAHTSSVHVAMFLLFTSELELELPAKLKIPTD